jgi:hypothetical protein
VRKKSSVRPLVSRSRTSLKCAWSAARPSARPATSGSWTSTPGARGARWQPPTSMPEQTRPASPPASTGRASRKWTRLASTAPMGSSLAGKDRLADQGRVGGQRPGGLRAARREPDPGEQPADQEQRVRLGAGDPWLEDQVEDEACRPRAAGAAWPATRRSRAASRGSGRLELAPVSVATRPRWRSQSAIIERPRRHGRRPGGERRVRGLAAAAAAPRSREVACEGLLDLPLRAARTLIRSPSVMR